ncbi:MAG: hypothetical protein HPY76_11725 [Anaerolineae bacterium]|nr:hypothetical protein [Anaerolineae bacterium]
MLTKRFNLLFDRLLRKTWTEEQINKYIGVFKRCYFTYATDTSLRERSASGGSVTAMLAYMLQNKMIGGAVVVRSVVQEGNKVRPEFFIAQTVEELKSAQGSKYSAVYFSSQAIPLIKDFGRPVAVVALPCDTRILRQAMRHDLALQQNVKLIITLFCGHNSEPELTDHVVKKLQPDDHPLVEYLYRIGHWRGQLQATYEGNQVVTKPFTYFSNYQNLFFFAQRKCHHCYDHTGYYGDISAGDIWSLRMKNEPIKHTAIITRSAVGDQLVAEMFEKGILTGQEASISEVCDGQARILPAHYNISARSKLNWLTKERIKDPVKEKVRLHDYIVAALNLFNERLSRTTRGRKIIFATPKPLIRLYLVFIKFLESF